MKIRCLATNFLSVLGMLILISGSPVLKQNSATAAPKSDNQSSSDDSMQLGITPYLWFAGVHGVVAGLGHEAGVHAGIGDVLSNFNIGLMGVAEPHSNRVVMPVDFKWVKLSDDKALPFDKQALSIQAKRTQTILTPKIGHRFVDKGKFKVDAPFGIRYGYLANLLTLQPTQVGNGFPDFTSWVDGVARGKIEALLTNWYYQCSATRGDF